MTLAVDSVARYSTTARSAAKTYSAVESLQGRGLVSDRRLLERLGGMRAREHAQLAELEEKVLVAAERLHRQDRALRRHRE